MHAVREQRSRKLWRWAWTAWASGTVGSFIVLERAALRRNCHPTLSTTLRRTLGIHPHHRWGSAALVVFTALWAWLVAHLARVPEDVVFGLTPPRDGQWVEVAPGLWYRTPRRRRLI
jgi:hypothetical protein